MDNVETANPIFDVPKTAIWQLLELAVGAQCRADFAQLQVNDIVRTAVDCGATWEQVGKWLRLSPQAAEERFADSNGSITLDEDVVINLGYIAKTRGLPTFSAALGFLLDYMASDLGDATATTAPVPGTES